MKIGTNLYVTGKDILGNTCQVSDRRLLPRVPTTSKSALSDVTDNTFWSPYQ